MLSSPAANTASSPRPRYPAGKDSYPVVSYTWLLCYKKYTDKSKMETLKSVIKYCLAEGQKSSDEYGYIALPEVVTSKVEKALDQFAVKAAAGRRMSAPNFAAISVR